MPHPGARRTARWSRSSVPIGGCSPAWACPRRSDVIPSIFGERSPARGGLSSSPTGNVVSATTRRAPRRPAARLGGTCRGTLPSIRHCGMAHIPGIGRRVCRRGTALWEARPRRRRSLRTPPPTPPRRLRPRCGPVRDRVIPTVLSTERRRRKNWVDRRRHCPYREGSSGGWPPSRAPQAPLQICRAMGGPLDQAPRRFAFSAVRPCSSAPCSRWTPRLRSRFRKALTTAERLQAEVPSICSLPSGC
mmetsp:Transcript_71531/g.205216  ORF Transcript_71531/g.205216 Transcript_71531/m.205216 type:complete len:247 (+) Transcript_71531:864-1604(+)